MAYINIKDTKDKDSGYMVEPGIESIVSGLLHLALGFFIAMSLKANFGTFYK